MALIKTIKTFRIKKFKIKNSLAKLEKVSLSYDKRQILDNININLNSGEIIGLLGPNGAGKSTIFNLLIGLVKPNFGKVVINNNNVNDEPVYIRAKKYKIGYVPQYGGRPSPRPIRLGGWSLLDTFMI